MAKREITRRVVAKLLSSGLVAAGLVGAGGVSGCCFGGQTTATPPALTPTTTATGPATVTGPAVAGAPFNIGPGFMPDPTTAAGMAGGPIAANTMNPECRGYIAAQPNHILNATGMFTNLRILAASSADLTLVVQRADGSFVCNDDSPGGGLQPEIAGMFGPGQHRIWIGTYSSSSGPQAYTLGLTEMPTVTHASLGGGGGIPGMPTMPGLPAIAGGLIPQECGQSSQLPTHFYGPIQVGTMITVGAHTPYTGIGAAGTMVTNDINWASEMQAFVGQRTTVTELSGVDDAGCPVVKVAVDGGQYYWRVRNMTL